MKWLLVSNRPSKSFNNRFKGIDWVFAVFFVLLCGSNSLLREGGPIGITAVVIVCSFYVVLRRGWINVLTIWLFSLYGIFYMILSYFDVFPDAWTTYFDRSSILRQGYYVVALVPVFSSCYILWRRAIQHSKMLSLSGVIVIIVTVIHLISLYLGGQANEGIGDGSVFFVGLMNDDLIFFLVAGLLILNTSSLKKHFFSLALFIVLLIDSNSKQTHLVGLVILLLSVISFPRLLVLGISFSLILQTFYVAYYLDTVITFDSNTIHRTLMWVDAWQAFLQSYGIGVGFGKEVVSNWYPLLSEVSPSKEDTLLFQGIHNSFINSMMRMGLPGVILMALFYIKGIPGSSLPLKRKRIGALAWFIAFLSSFVNVGLESPMAFFGIMFTLSLAFAINRNFRKTGVDGRIFGVRELGVRATPTVGQSGAALGRWER